MDLTTPILIVGGGPVGLALAGDLGWRGIPCVLIEQSDGSIYQPRQDLVGIRTMEFCRRWGLVEAVEAAPYPRDVPQDNVYVTSLAGYELGRERFPSMGDQTPPSVSPQKRERCPQNMFDPILRAFAAAQPGVALRHRTRLVGFTQDGGHVTAQVEDLERGGRYAITAQYLAGCDGARSLVRETLGIAMSGNAALTYTTNVIFRCPDLVALHDKGQAYRFIILGPEGTWATIVAINGRDQWRFSLIGSQEQRERSEDGDPRGDPARRRRGLRLRDPQHRSLGAPRAGGRTLSRRAQLHPGRRRPHDVAHRRVRHEHRRRRRGRPLVEARRGAGRLGRLRPCSIPTKPSGGRSGPATSPRRAATCVACCRRGRGRRSSMTRPKARAPARRWDANSPR